MLKPIGKTFFTGLITILPVILTLYLIYWLLVSAESVFGSLIQQVLPENLYWPGMGTVAALVLVFLVGLMMHTYLMQRLFSWGEQILYHLPLVKSIYRASRDFFNYFSPDKEKEFEQVVAVSIGNTDMQLIGFVSQATPEHLPTGFGDEDSVLVYLPMSYMIGGYAILMPRSAVRPLNMSIQEAMRFTLTAGVAGTNGNS